MNKLTKLKAVCNESIKRGIGIEKEEFSYVVQNRRIAKPDVEMLYAAREIAPQLIEALEIAMSALEDLQKTPELPEEMYKELTEGEIRFAYRGLILGRQTQAVKALSDINKLLL